MLEQPSHGAHTGRGNPVSAGPRARMLRLTVLPAALVAAIAVTALAALLRRTHATVVPGDTGALWGLLGGGAMLTCGVLTVAAAAASGEARVQGARLAALRRQVARTSVDLHALLRKLERGEPVRTPSAPSPAEPGSDAFDLLAHEIAAARHTAELAVVEAAAVRGAVGGSAAKPAAFVNLARRVQSFAHRQIEHLDELESELADPDLRSGLFSVDHLATRIRRHAENLAVLGGAVARRRWTRPARLTEVLRSAVAEVADYRRVTLVPPIEGTVRGHAVADVIHLLVELIENATAFSAPQTHVLLRVQPVAAGLAIEVEDRGLGMTAADQSRMNAVLAGAGPLDLAELLDDGRVGLFVVSTLARRHHIGVRLQGNIHGGIQAGVTLPHELLGDAFESHDVEGGHCVEKGGPAQTGRGSEDSPPADGEVPAMVTTERSDLPELPELRTLPELPDLPDLAAELPDPAVRPPLPRRHRHQHLVHQLRDADPAAGPAVIPAVTSRTGAESEEAVPDPGLLALFRRGASLADTTDERP